VDEAGETFDFHALRGQFVTELDRAGVSLVKAQKLARHSTPNFTANLYTRLRRADLQVEVDKLPLPPIVVGGDKGTFAPGFALDVHFFSR
jgi:integrase